MNKALTSLFLIPASALGLWILVPSGAIASTPTRSNLILAQDPSPEDRKAEADRLLEQGIQQFDMSQFQEALQSWQRALELYRDPAVQAAFPQESRQGEGRALGNLGLVYRNLGQYQQAIDFYEQSFAIAQEVGDLWGEGEALNNLGIVHDDLGQYQQVIDFYEQSLVIFREIGDPNGERRALGSLGFAYQNLGQYQQAIDFFKQQLAIIREIDNSPEERLNQRWRERHTLSNLGLAYWSLGQYQQAAAFYEQSLVIAQEIDDPWGEGETLNSLGWTYLGLGQYPQAIALFEQALEIFQRIDDRWGEGSTLDNLSEAYAALGQYQEAADFYEQGLVIFEGIDALQEEGSALKEADRLLEQGVWQYQVSEFQEALQSWERALELYRDPAVQAVFPQESRQGEGHALSNLGLAYRNLGQPQQAIDFYEQSLVIFREVSNSPEERLRQRQGEGNALNALGIAYADLGQYQQAIDFYEQSLVIFRDLDERGREGGTLNNLGEVYRNLGQYQQAIDYYEQSLAIARETSDSPEERLRKRQGEGKALANLGNAYAALGQYQQAIDFYEQSLAIAREIDNRQGEGIALGNLGIVHDDLGQYQQAINYYEQQLVIAREINYRQGEGNALGSLGSAYAALGQYQQAVDFHEQSLVIFREIGDRRAKGIVLGNLGNAYVALDQYQQALERYQQALTIAQEIGDRWGEGIALGNLGIAYRNLGQYQQALEGYQQALAIAQEIGNRSGEGLWLSNMGYLLAEQGQPELAIVFYKQSVNVREAIRADLRGLSQEQQQSYTETIADSYRSLADLLLQQNRVLEAQRVLDLLRVQELDDYLRGVRTTAQTESGIELRDPEQEISNRVIAVGYELAQLRDIQPNQLSDHQLQRLAQLDADQRAMNADFLGFINSAEVQALVVQLDASLREQDVLARAEEFVNLQNNLRAIDQNAVLIYPLILPDRLEIVLVTPFGAPARYPVPVGSTELNAAIVEFRQALNDPTSDPRPIAQRLYQWLMAPLTNDLQAIGAETILYAPDGVLRYVPLAALHDGDQWLIETYRINHITAASLQDFTLRPAADPLILAAAFSEGAFEFQIGQRSFSFGGLPFAGVEVENLAAAFPGTTQLMNDRFSRLRVEPLMDSHTIVHLATHAAFVPGSLADSFILFGNGDRLSLQEIRDTWQGRFNRVELIVLSACETGVGDTLGTGEEILGFGYLMQEAGASAAIASLWAVNDGGTQVLMNAFYSALDGELTKAEALRQAQIALITRNFSAVGDPRGDAAIEIISTRTGLPASVSDRLSHPYYWAPFILIGNGL